MQAVLNAPISWLIKLCCAPCYLHLCCIFEGFVLLLSRVALFSLESLKDYRADEKQCSLPPKTAHQGALTERVWAVLSKGHLACCNDGYRRGVCCISLHARCFSQAKIILVVNRLNYTDMLF